MSNLLPPGYSDEKLREFWSRNVNARKAKVVFANPGAFLDVVALIREQQPDGRGYWATVKTNIRDDAEIDDLLAKLEARINTVLNARFPLTVVNATQEKTA